MINNYLNEDANLLFQKFKNNTDRDWAWWVLEGLRARYPQADHWTTGGKGSTYTDLRVGRRKPGQVAANVFYLIRLVGGRPTCYVARWLAQGASERATMSSFTHPTQPLVNQWLDQQAVHLASQIGGLIGNGLKPIDYGVGQPIPTDEEGDEKAILMNADELDLPLNQILYGPPGTGKTYATVDEALRVLDPAFIAANPENSGSIYIEKQARRATLKNRFDELVLAGRVRFVTFHQSFSYEDFVEGIRAEANESGPISYPVVDGIFKDLCNRAKSSASPQLEVEQAIKLEGRRIWKMSLGSADGDDAYVFHDCMKDGLALLGYGYSLDYRDCPNRDSVAARMKEHGHVSDLNDYAATAVNNFVNKMKPSDLVVVTNGNLKFRAIGEVTGNYDYLTRDDDYKQARKVKWLRRYEPSLGFAELMNNRFSQMTLYELRAPSIDLLKLQGLLAPIAEPGLGGALPYMLIIDEINRGSVSRIFGELITLIEPSKRIGAPEALSVTLPYSKETFSVPGNVYILGTMNTADRSLTGLDIALRRRFEFKELPPRADLLASIEVSGVNIGKLIDTMNARIEVLLDREHLLGHASFMCLAEDGKNTLDRLARVFRNQIVPLLQEYFFEDWERIALVLNDQGKQAEHQFIQRYGLGLSDLFGREQGAALRDRRWRINDSAFDHIESYTGILPAGL